MFAKSRHMMIGLLGIALAGGLLSCQLFDRNDAAVTLPQQMTNIAPTANYIVGDGEDDDWAGWYEPGQSYFKVTTKPGNAVLKIRYDIAQGGAFTIILKAGKRLTHEIGLKAGDVVSCVTVAYVEGGEFSAIPANAKPKEGNGYTQYQRSSGSAETDEWWPDGEAAGFVMTGATAEQPIFCGGQWFVAKGKPAAGRGSVTTTTTSGATTTTAAATTTTTAAATTTTAAATTTTAASTTTTTTTTSTPTTTL